MIDQMIRTAILVFACVLAAASPARAQGNWDVAVYPVLAWVPLGIDINVDVPPHDGGGGGTTEIIDGSFDGAFLGGVAATNGKFRVDADVIWAAVGGDRVERPALTVDLDLIYGRFLGSYAVVPDVYVTGGVRRMALKYDITFGDQGTFSRDPGIWDPLIGVAWHRKGGKMDWHANFEGGGFGVGADVDLGATFRFDWKPTTHFGLTAGYTFLYLKISDEVRDRTWTVKQSLHGPVVGLGLYF